MRCVKSCLRLVVTATVALGLSLGPVPKAHADQPGAILNVWPLKGGGPSAGDGSEAKRSAFSTGPPASKGSPSRCPARSSFPPAKRRRGDVT